MNGLGGLNKSPNGVVVGVVQSQLPVVATPADLAAQTQKIVATVGKARRNMAGGAGDCPYTFMQDLVAGRYRLPWEDEVVHKDGTAYGFPKPSRRYGDKLSQAAE